MRKRLNIFIAGMLISAIGMLSSGTTIAAGVIQGSTVNYVNTTIAGEIVEAYQAATGVLPGGASVDKIVNVKNTGAIDMLSRIKVTKVWKDLEGNATDLPADNIIIDFNNTQWLYSDGYYYYKGVLRPGETTSAPLFTEFRIDEATDNRYKDLSADIVVSLECVQAGGNGAAAWSTTLEQLGIVYEETQPSVQTDIIFDGAEFTFDGKVAENEQGDLFAGFKGLIPGSSRTQVINISNTSGKKSEIFLKADYIAQPDENAALAEQLVTQQLTVTVSDSDGNTLYTGPIEGNLGAQAGAQTMKDFISLGSFENTQSKTLTVALSAKSDMGNEFQNLTGKILWQLKASNVEPTSVTETSSSTTTTTTEPSSADESSSSTEESTSATEPTPPVTSPTSPVTSTTTTTTTTTAPTTTTTKPATTTSRHGGGTATTAPTTTTTTTTTASAGDSTAAPGSESSTLPGSSSADSSSGNSSSGGNSGSGSRPGGSRPGGSSSGGSNTGGSGEKSTTAGSSSGTGIKLPTTGGKLSYAVFFTSFISFIFFLCAYIAGRKKERLES